VVGTCERTTENSFAGARSWIGSAGDDQLTLHPVGGAPAEPQPDVALEPERERVPAKPGSRSAHQRPVWSDAPEELIRLTQSDLTSGCKKNVHCHIRRQGKAREFISIMPERPLSSRR